MRGKRTIGSPPLCLPVITSSAGGDIANPASLSIGGFAIKGKVELIGVGERL
jgi:hypothetical protein